MVRSTVIFTLFLLISLSCEKDDTINNLPARVKLDISYHLFAGKQINCIDFNKGGNPYIGSGTQLYYHQGSELKSLEAGFNILDLAVAPDQTVWIGTNGGGLGHLDGDRLEWYNSSNAGLPRDVVMNVEVAPDGVVWFASCAHRLGGLGIYDGKSFTFLTPENSPLNQNIIDDIEISPVGDVYIATAGTVGKTNIYKISRNSWECLGNEEGTFYWSSSFTLSPDGSIFLVEDFSLSSLWQENRVIKSGSRNWEVITYSEKPRISYFSPVKADKRNYCWIASSSEEGPGLLVFDGKEWFRSTEGSFQDAGIITSIETDNENNIWVGTYRNGIFILNQ